MVSAITPFGSKTISPKPPSEEKQQDDGSKAKRPASPTMPASINKYQRTSHQEVPQGYKEIGVEVEFNFMVRRAITKENSEPADNAKEETFPESKMTVEEYDNQGQDDLKRASIPSPAATKKSAPAPGDDDYMNFMNSTEFSTEEEGQEYLQRTIATILKGGGLQSLAQELYDMRYIVNTLIELAVDADDTELKSQRERTPGCFRAKVKALTDTAQQFAPFQSRHLMKQLQAYERKCAAVEKCNGKSKECEQNQPSDHKSHKLTRLDHLAETANGYLAQVDHSETLKVSGEAKESEKAIPIVSEQAKDLCGGANIYKKSMDDSQESEGTSEGTVFTPLKPRNLSDTIFSPKPVRSFRPLKYLRPFKAKERTAMATRASEKEANGEEDSDEEASTLTKKSSGRTSTMNFPKGTLLATTLLQAGNDNCFKPIGHSWAPNKGECTKQVKDGASVATNGTQESGLTGHHSPISPSYSPPSTGANSPISQSYSPDTVDYGPRATQRSPTSSDDSLFDEDGELSYVAKSRKPQTIGYLKEIDKFGNPITHPAPSSKSMLFDDPEHLLTITKRDPIIDEFGLETENKQEGKSAATDEATGGKAEELGMSENDSDEDSAATEERHLISRFGSMYDQVFEPSLRATSPAMTQGYAESKSLPFKIWMHYAGTDSLVAEVAQAAFNANVAVSAGKFEQHFERSEVIQILKECYQSYSPSARDSANERNRKDEYYGLNEILKNVLHEVVNMYPRERRKQYRPAGRAATHLSDLERLDDDDPAIQIMSSILFTLQFVRCLHQQLSFYSDGHPTSCYDKDLSNGSLRRRLMRLSVSRRIYNILFPEEENSQDPSRSWMNRIPLLQLPMPFVPKLLKDLPSLFIDDVTNDICDAAAAEVAKRAKKSLIANYKPSPREPAYNYVKALFDHLIGFVQTQIIQYYQTRETLRNMPSNLCILNVHSIPPMQILAGGEYICSLGTTATRWDEGGWLSGKKDTPEDMNICWIINHTPSDQSCLRLNGHTAASHQANEEVLKPVDPVKICPDLDTATESYYKQIHTVNPVGLEEVTANMQEKFQPKGKRAIFVPIEQEDGTVDLTDETADPKFKRGMHEFPQFFDEHGRAINSQPNGKPHDRASLRKMFNIRMCVEVQSDGTTPENQRDYISRTNTMATREEKKMIMTPGLTPKQLPYELADRATLQVSRKPFDRQQLIIAWGLTTIDQNNGICYADWERRKYSFHNFLNSHPERLFGRTFRYASDPPNMRRPVGNYFGKRISDDKALRVEDFPTYGKSRKAYAWNVLPNNGSPLPPFRPPQSTMQSSRPSSPNVQEPKRFVKESDRSIFIQKRVPLEVQRGFTALMASATRSNKQKLHVKTVKADSDISSMSSGEDTEGITSIDQPAITLSPIGERPPTPLSQASTKSQPWSQREINQDMTQYRDDYPPLTQIPSPPAPYRSTSLDERRRNDPRYLVLEQSVTDEAQKESKGHANESKEKARPNLWTKKDVIGILKNPDQFDNAVEPNPVSKPVPPLTNLPSKEQLYPSFHKPTPRPATIQSTIAALTSHPLKTVDISAAYNSIKTEEEQSKADSDKKPPFELHTPKVTKAKVKEADKEPPDSSDSSSEDSLSKKQKKKSKKTKKGKKDKKRKQKSTYKSNKNSSEEEDSDHSEDESDSSDDSYKILKCPSVETLTRILVKHARNSRLRNLDYQNDLDTRRRRFNSFIDILTIVCQISPWTSAIFEDWPSTVKIDYKNVNTALFNLIFTHANEACQKHLLEDGESCAVKALKTLQRHCAPITDDHLEKMDIQFRSLTQGDNEVATSYFNRIRETKRDCYHAGLTFTSLELLNRAIRGASSNQLYDTTYKSFERKLDDHRLTKTNPEPTFIELEVALSRIDERRGLTTSHGNNRRNNAPYQGAYAAIGNQSNRRNTFGNQNQSNYRRTQNYGGANNYNRRGTFSSANTTRHCTYCNRPGHNFAECRTRVREASSNPINRPTPTSGAPVNRFRQVSNFGNRTSHFNNSSRAPQFQARTPQYPPRPTTSTAGRGACHSCGRMGHYARDCRSRPQQSGNENRRPLDTNNFRRTPANVPRNQAQARPTNFRPTNNGARALLAKSDDATNIRFEQFETALVATIKQKPEEDFEELNRGPLVILPPYPPGYTHTEKEEESKIEQNMEVPEPTAEEDIHPYNPLVMNNYLSGDPEYFHEDPASPHQRFGPPILQNWMPDSGATSHFTPVYSDLINVKPSCHHVQMADGTTVIASHVGDVPCYFTNDQGDPCTILLTQVYYVAGLNFRLLSLNYSTAAAGNTVQIANNATTLTFPNNTTFTWPILRRDYQQALSTSLVSEETESTKRTISPVTSPLSSLPLELVSQRLGFRNVRTLLTGSLYSVWRDSQLVPGTDNNNWPVKISVSHKHARSKEPTNTGSTVFNYLHLDLIRNPYLFGLTTNTNFTAYLFIVATPGKLVGWVGLPDETTEALLAGLKSWLVSTESLGRKHNVRFIRTDAGSAFTSEDFIKACVDLNIKIEAAAPKHQEMNGICESKWKQVHSLANTLLTNARLGGAFFHFAHAYAVAITNIMPAKNIVDKDNLPTTPYHLCYGRKPRIRNFRTFGCPTYFKRYEPTMDKQIVTKKLQIQQASRGIFLGFPDNSAGWLVYSAEMKHKIEISRDAYFDEYFQSALTFDSKPFQGAVAIRPDMDPSHLTPAYSNRPDKPDLKVGSVADLGVLPSIFVEPTMEVETVDSESDEEEEEQQNTNSPTIGARHKRSRNTPMHPTERALCAVRADFAACNEHSPDQEPGTALSAIDKNLAQVDQAEEIAKYLPEPQSLKAVIGCDPDIKKAWLHTIFLELKNLIDNDTFIRGVTPNKGELITPVKLVNKAKQAASGELDKLKSRLVARGDYQKRRMKRRAQGIIKARELQKEINAQALREGNKPATVTLPTSPDEDTWSPNASARGVKIFIALMTSLGRTIKEADFIGAYLQAKMKGRHFVIIRKEYAEFFPEYADYFGVPLLLNKGMYGLVFSGKLWNEEYCTWLKSQGFSQSQTDQSIFVKRYPGGGWLRLIFFVDDMLYCGSSDTIEMDFQATVHDRFHVKFLGPAHWFLQMRLHQHKDRSYTLDQYRYVLNTLKRYDSHNIIKKRQTPLPPDYIFSKDNRPKNQTEIDLIDEAYSSFDFRSAVCTLLYLAYNTRADILFAVTKLAKACVCPGIKDYAALYWLIGYIKERPDLALKFYPNKNKNPIKLLCDMNNIPYSDLALLTDASWADCPDTGRSTVGYLLFWQGALIEANTSVPTPIAQSSAESEYLSACSGAMAAAHVRMIIYDILHLGTPEWQNHNQMLTKTPLLLMTDNAATIQIAKSGRLTRKTRHIEKRFHYVRESIQNKTQCIFWLPGSQMLADVMTKSQAAYKIDPHLPSILSQLPLHMVGTQQPKDDTNEISKV